MSVPSDLSRDVSDRILDPIRRLRARARVLLIAQRIGVVVGAAVLGALVVALLDSVLRLPAWMRGVILGGGVVAVALASWRWVRPAVLFKPSIVDVALRIERARPELRGMLASAVDFVLSGDAGGDAPMTRSMAARVVDGAAGDARVSEVMGLLRPSSAARGTSFALLACVAVIALLAVNAPMWLTGAQRVLAPWSGASWPKRTQIADLTVGGVHPTGRALALQAALLRSSRPAASTDVAVRYRLIENGQAGPAQRALLTWQDRSVTTPDGRVGALFERLVEPVADAVTYRIETEDDATPWRTIRLVSPPAVAGASAVVIPPSYLSLAAGAASEPRELDLGPGTDERAIAPPSLVGSAVRMELTLNKPAIIDGAHGLFEQVDPGGSVYAAEFDLDASKRFAISLTDEHGIISVDEAVFRFEATEDRAPAATVTEPGADQSVLATAVVDVTGEGRDDVGLDWVSLERQTFRPAGREGSEPSGPGGAVEASGAPIEVVRTAASGARTAQADARLDLSVLGLRAGDELHITALASDVLAAGSRARDATRSPVRTLRIISQAAFIEEIQDELAELRQSAGRIREQQVDLRGEAASRGAERSVVRGQGQVSERLGRQTDRIGDISERVRRNGLGDEGLAELLDEATRSLESAGQASASASAQLGRASAEQRASGAGDQGDGGEEGDGGGDREEAALDAETAQAVADDQEEVVAELDRLIELLDRGEDNWVVRATLERLVGEQRSLEERTRAAGAMTAGRSAEDLTPRERSELERIVDRQTELAEQVEDLVQEMREREQQLSQADPAAAAGMRQAAQSAEERQIAQTMRDAAEEAAGNEMANASEQQEQAIEDLEEMLDDLEAGERNRDEMLRRMLAQVMDSIRMLIEDQESEITALEDALAAGDGIAGLDAGMITLNQNTLGVIDVTRSQGNTMAPVATALEGAADAQVAAIQAFRAVRPDADAARAAEERSLELLRRALAQAEELDQAAAERQRARKLAELRAAYREALEAQVALRGQTEDFAALEEISRRNRVRIRKLAEPQDAIRDRLGEILGETAELTEARVFEYAHKRLDNQCQRSADALIDADARTSYDVQQRIVRMLQELLEALEDPKPTDEDFEDGQQQAGGQQGGGQMQDEPLIPLLKELILLRLIQEDIAEQTAATGQDQGDTIRDLATQQRDLVGLAQDLVERLQGGPGAAFPGLEPAGGNADEDSAVPDEREEIE